MAGLDSSPPASDGGNALAAAGANSAGPIAALLAALGSGHGKSAHKGSQFFLPSTTGVSTSADSDLAGSMPNLFGACPGKSSGKGQVQGAYGHFAGSLLGAALPGTPMPSLLAAPGPVPNTATDLEAELSPAAGETTESSNQAQGPGKAVASVPTPPQQLPSASQLLVPVALSMPLAGNLAVPSASPGGNPAPITPTSGVPVNGLGGYAVGTAGTGVPPPALASMPSAAVVAQCLPRSEKGAIGPRGGDGGKALNPDTRSAPASAVSDAAPSVIAGATPTAAAATESGKIAEAVLPNLPAGGGEKFAGLSSGAGNGGSMSGNDSNKNSLANEDKGDAKQSSVIGTTGAESAAVMPSSRSNRTTAPVGEPRAFLSPATATATSTLPAATAAVAGPAASAAHRAIESIARIADVQATRAGSADSVSFGFKVGDQNLTVRVEMRGGEVRTQFSTDSADLRSALANEWSTLANGADDRSYHFSAPVFTTADGRPADAGSDTGGSSREAPSQSSMASSRLVSASDDAVEVSSSFVPTAAPVTAQHLHTFA
jgi:hypothetical protein